MSGQRSARAQYDVALSRCTRVANNGVNRENYRLPRESFGSCLPPDGGCFARRDYPTRNRRVTSHPRTRTMLLMKPDAARADITLQTRPESHPFDGQTDERTVRRADVYGDGLGKRQIKFSSKIAARGVTEGRLKGRQASRDRDGRGEALCATMALLRHPLIAPSALMDPRENCIDLSPSERGIPTSPSFSSSSCSYYYSFCLYSVPRVSFFHPCLSFLFRFRGCRLSLYRLCPVPTSFSTVFLRLFRS